MNLSNHQVIKIQILLKTAGKNVKANQALGVRFKLWYGCWKWKLKGKSWGGFTSWMLSCFFFSCSRSSTNINEYEHKKRRPSANVNRGGSRGKVRSGRGGGERTPSHKNCGYFYFLSESMIPPTTGWHITAKFPRLKHLSHLFRLLCKKKNESKIKPLNQKFLDPTLPLCIQTCWRHT